MPSCSFCSYRKYGGISYLIDHVPSDLFTWNGGNSKWYIISWYFIALATLIEPAFYQRCYAAKDIKVARNGIFISIAFWALFDFMTTFCGLYARAILPDLANPVGSYPALAMKVLPTGLLGLFALALLATVMSTIDSYAFIAASTFSRDIVMRLYPIPEEKVTRYTRIGLVVTTAVAVLLVLKFRSIVQIWYLFGTIGTPALLVPVFFSFVGKRRLPSSIALATIVSSGGIALLWYLSKHLTVDGGYWLGIQPIFPGLVLSLVFYFAFSRRERPAQSTDTAA